MKASDKELVFAAGEKFTKALQAAAISLRSDGRMTGLPHIRSQLEEICALRALGSTTGLSKAESAAIARDTATHNAVMDATEAAINAARKAIGE